MKIGCVIAQITLDENIHEPMDGLDQSRYDELAQCAVQSFKHWNPDIDLHYVNDTNFEEYYEKYFSEYELINHVGIVRYMLAYEIMVKDNYDKMIVLGCDTITCSRLEEFRKLDDPIVATLNYPVIESTEYWKTLLIEFSDLNHPGKQRDVLNLNADVICFNDIGYFKDLIDLSMKHFTHFGEQGALNEMATDNKDIWVPEFPYFKSKVVYNARAKGVPGTNMIAGNLPFHVEGDKLMTHDGKHIKMWHYCEGLGGRPQEDFDAIMNDFKTKWFNNETRKFFVEKCDCKNFFSYI